MNPQGLELRDIHLPPDVSWWPPAIGWWILLALIVIVASVLTARHWWQKTAVRRAAFANLARIERQWLRQKNAHELVCSLSSLLRRVALAGVAREQVAALTGAKWAQHLDGFVGNDSFTNGVGTLLVTGPYQQQLDANENDLADLMALCKHAIALMSEGHQAHG